jgi:hypothetical protein
MYEKKPTQFKLTAVAQCEQDEVTGSHVSQMQLAFRQLDTLKFHKRSVTGC